MLLFVLGASACKESIALSLEQLMDPAACKSCHPGQFREWSGSMHAYAADDPVFIAMNARGQRETGGALGDFCVRCHAPMAVRTGATRDGLNLSTLPPSMRGVTCYFCHQVRDLAGSHNNPLILAGDVTMRGGIRDPMPLRAHRAAYSRLHDRESRDSAALCGSCHDVVTPAGVHLERTFLEWKGSLFATGDARQQLTCGQCHMPGRPGMAADVPGATIRLDHDHMMPGVDVALSPFPEMKAQRQAVQRELDTAVQARLCVRMEGADLLAELTLDNVGSGHDFPSGAAHDRRAWIELVAYSGGAIVYQSGNVAEGQAAAELTDPKLWLMRERIYDKSGREVHMFWDAARYEAEHLPPTLTNDRNDRRYVHAVTRTYRIPEIRIDRITTRMRLRPIDQDVLADLARTGDLHGPMGDSAGDSVRASIPTFTLGGTVAEWRRGGPPCVP
jgi:hypothetical protein